MSSQLFVKLQYIHTDLSFKICLFRLNSEKLLKSVSRLFYIKHIHSFEITKQQRNILKFSRSPIESRFSRQLILQYIHHLQIKRLKKLTKTFLIDQVQGVKEQNHKSNFNVTEIIPKSLIQTIINNHLVQQGQDPQKKLVYQIKNRY